MAVTIARVRRSVLLLALLATALLTGAAPAQAHTGLTGSVPADGADVAQAPDAVQLGFAEQVRADLTHVAVTGPDGVDVAAGAPQVDGRTVVQPIGALTVAGSYTVAYRIVGPDGHPVTGTTSFTLTAVPAAPVAEEPVAAAPEPAPVVAANSEPQQPAAAPTTEDGVGTVVWLLAGAAALGALTMAAFWARRRRPASGPADRS